MLIRILNSANVQSKVYSIITLIFAYIRSIYEIEKYFILLSIKNLNIYA